MNSPPTRKELLLGGGHLAALWALALVQPLLDLLGKNPDFFVARDNGPADILILALGFTLVPPLVLLAIEAVTVKLAPAAYRLLHLLLTGTLVAALFMQVISRTVGGPTVVILAVALAAGVIFALAVQRSGFLRNLLDLLIVAPVVILALFVFASPATALIFPGNADPAAGTDTGDDTPVVLVIFDELGTADLMTGFRSIDRDRYPNLARLSREGSWYINHTTTDFFTPRAVPGILTGRLPPDDALPTARDQPDSIFTRLGRDRPVHVMEPVTALCPDSLCPEAAGGDGLPARLGALWRDLRYVEGRLILPPGLAARLPDVSGTFEGFGQPEDPDDTRTRRFFTKGLDLEHDAAAYRQFIHRIPASRRGLTVMHLLLPHQPWRLTPTGRTFNPPPFNNPWDSDTDRWRVDSGGIASAQARMYTQTGFADRLIGELRRTLRRKGLWNDAIVVVTADHGTSFEGGPVARRRVDERVMGEVANPPLLIKYPGQKRGGTVRAHSLTLDILPTILRAVGAGEDGDFDGVPLQGRIPPRPVRVKDVIEDDRVVTVKPVTVIRQREKAIRRANRRLGSGPFYTLGPAPELIGRRVSPVPAGTGAARLDDPELWENVDPVAEPVPAFITGTLDPGERDGTTVAVALNGRVRGSGRSFAFEGANRFGILVDPSALRAGRNEIGIYAVKKGRLMPLGGNRPGSR